MKIAALSNTRSLSINTRLLGLFLFFCGFEFISWLISLQEISLSTKEWIMLALASSMGGRAIAYMAIGEWIRFPITKTVKHSADNGEDVEPKYTDGFIGALAALVSCPICAGAWTGLGLLLLYAYLPHMGQVMIWLFSAGAVAWFLTRLTELIEASTWVMRQANGYLQKLNRR